MKKKSLIITLSIVGAIILLVAIGFGILFLSGNTITTARCVVTDGGTLYMVYNERPIQLNYGRDTDYKTGDKLLIVHSTAFAESYPEQCRTVFVMKIGSGTEADIPKNVFNVFEELEVGKDVPPSILPSLEIIYGAKTYKPMRGTYSWTWDNGDGTFQTENVDSMHPTVAKDYMPEVMFFVSPLSSANPHMVYLNFDGQPTEISARAWHITDWKNFGDGTADVKITPYSGSEEESQYTLELKDVPYVYEITAKWDFGDGTGGTITYCFYTAENPAMDYNENK